jgi:RNase adaptor protein for sRNA GlmZ degradation
VTQATAPLLHATCVALDGRGVLLRGASGSGKSDLALRLIDEGALLVADDQTEIGEEQGRLVARAPAAIAGRLEVRGLGIVSQPALAAAPIALLVDLVPPAAVERLPEERYERLCGRALPVIALDPFAASAVAKIRLALERIALHETTAVASEPRRVVLVTGLSGAGRSLALATLEDLGYEAIDNLPLDLVTASLSTLIQRRPLAIGIDTRTRDFAAGRLLRLYKELRALPDIAATLVFIDCDDEALVRRFTETRRRHPLAQDRPVQDGIQAERQLMAEVKLRADLRFDTSLLTPAEFRRLLAGHLSLAGESGLGMMTFVTSFSYKLGLPREADLVFDVRFLRNPHYVGELKPQTGRDAAVARYVEEDPDFRPFFGQMTELLRPLLPRYEGEGKSYLTIAIGCTGGRHRSVFVAERLAQWLMQEGRPVVVAHRDLERVA